MKTRWTLVGIIFIFAFAIIFGFLIDNDRKYSKYEDSKTSLLDGKSEGIGFSPESDLCGGDESQIILKLSDVTNAHAEKPGTNSIDGYDIGVCYNEIFGVRGSGDRTCNNNNIVVRLSDTTNAHLEVPEQNNYPEEICYGDLNCKSTTDSCLPFERLVLKLSDATNAHAQTGGSYNYNICCSAAENIPPTGIIVNPEHLGIYFVDTTIEFEATAFGFEGEVDFLWTIFKGGEVEFTNTEQTFLHVFGETRQRVVRVRITDRNNPNIWAEDQISILIAGSERLLADINAPTRFEIVPNPNNDNRVRYNTSESYVVNTTLTSNSPCFVRMECLIGNCPAHPKNIPNGADSNICDPEDIDVTGSPELTGLSPNYSELRFTYSFDDGDSFTLDDKPTGIKVYPTGQDSNQLNDKWISLLLNHTAGASLTETVLNEFTLGYCLDDGNRVIDPNTGESIPTTGSDAPPGACASGDVGVGCCPAGMVCAGNPGEESCIFTDITMCADYTTIPVPDYTYQEACNMDVANIITEDPLYDPSHCGETINGSIYQCECKWRGSEPENGGECEFVLTIINGTGSDDNDPCTRSSCGYTYELGECIDGFMRITHTSTGQPENNSPEWCNQVGGEACGLLDLPSQVPCGRLNFQLSFFDYKQFVAVFVIVFLVYLFAYFERKKMT